jgi:hypothetical protein
MALTPAEKQQRYRDRLKEKAQVSSEAVETAFAPTAANYGIRNERWRTSSRI